MATLVVRRGCRLPGDQLGTFDLDAGENLLWEGEADHRATPTLSRRALVDGLVDLAILALAFTLVNRGPWIAVGCASAAMSMLSPRVFPGWYWFRARTAFAVTTQRLHFRTVDWWRGEVREGTILVQRLTHLHLVEEPSGMGYIYFVPFLQRVSRTRRGHATHSNLPSHITVAGAREVFATIRTAMGTRPHSPGAEPYSGAALEPGEAVVWTGKPDRLAVLVSSLPWLALSWCLLIGLLLLACLDRTHGADSALLRHIGYGGFVAYLVYSGVTMVRRTADGVSYVLTNRKIRILAGGSNGFREEVDLSLVAATELLPGPGGTGTIWFAEPPRHWLQRLLAPAAANRSHQPAFVCVSDAERLHHTIDALIAQFDKVGS